MSIEPPGHSRPVLGVQLKESKDQLTRLLAAPLERARTQPLLHRTVLTESWRERVGGHPVERDHRPHVQAAVEWLARSQDATPDDGFSRGYSLTWNVYLRQRGWQPSYPETTGYLIPTLYEAARYLAWPELAERAERAARWEIAIQLPTGAVRGGVIGQPISPAIFNTGQVMFGWLSAFEETGASIFADAASRAARFLVTTLGSDGHWRTGNSRFAHADATLYNARTAWALAEAGVRLDVAAYRSAAARSLRAVAARQHANGWLPACCLNDPDRPLLHTLAYGIRGLLEGGRVLEDDTLMSSAVLAAEQLAARVRDDGWMAGRFTADWAPAVTWSCLTGEAQMANIWLRLSELRGEAMWLDVVQRVLRFLKTTQNRTSRVAGIRGAIKGSFPLGGGYAAYEVLSWATKFFVDALIRDERAHAGATRAHARAFELA